MRLFLIGSTVLLASQAAPAYIEPVTHAQTAQTLPRLLLHFPHAIAQVEVDRLDLDRGAVRFRLIERISGKDETREFRHVVAPEGKTPPELSALKTGLRAILFGEDNEGQGFTYFDGVWYHTKRGEDSWRRMTGLRPLYLGAFAGSTEELAAALKKLLLGQDAVVPVLQEGQKIFVRYRMMDPHRKIAADPPPSKTEPDADAPRTPAETEKARIDQRKVELADLERRLREATQARGRDSEEVRLLLDERRRRREALEQAQAPQEERKRPR